MPELIENMNIKEIGPKVMQISKDLINIKKQMVIKNGNKYGCTSGD